MRAEAPISVMVLLLAGCQTGPKNSTSAPQNKLDQAALLLESESIGAIRVVHSPASEHPFRLTLDALMSGSPYSLELSGVALDAKAQKLAGALRSSDAVDATWSGDVNWGIVLYNRSEKEVIRIGLDESGRHGYVGTEPVRVRAKLAELSRKLLPE